jgi:hypothetical protein
MEGASRHSSWGWDASKSFRIFIRAAALVAATKNLVYEFTVETINLYE